MARYERNSTPKLTNKLIEEISQLLEKGNFVESSAAACGISKDTFYRWLRNGKGESPSLLEKKLSDAVMRSIAKAEISDLARIDEFAKLPNGFRAVAWRLERRFPKKWGAKNCEEEIIDEEDDREIIITFVDSENDREKLSQEALRKLV